VEHINHNSDGEGILVGIQGGGMILETISNYIM